MITEKVFSPIKDDKIGRSKYDLLNSPIWDICYKEEEVTKELKERYGQIYCYFIKFDGTKVIQFTKRKTTK